MIDYLTDFGTLVGSLNDEEKLINDIQLNKKSGVPLLS
jgi:hypothetical protein